MILYQLPVTAITCYCVIPHRETLQTHYWTSPGFYVSIQYKSFENTVVKAKLLLTSNFSFSHCVFCLFQEFSFIFVKFKIVCKLFQFGRVLNLSFGKVLSHIEFVVSASALNLDELTIFLSGKGVTLYHTILTFNNPKEEARGLWEKNCKKKKKEMLITSIFLLFPSCFIPFEGQFLSFAQPLIFCLWLFTLGSIP